MKHIIEASVPTHHKLNAIRKFGMPTILNADGSITAKQMFDSKEDAVAHLMSVADGEDQEQEILQYDSMTYDAVCADIRPATLLDKLEPSLLDKLEESMKPYPHTWEELKDELDSNYWVSAIKFESVMRIYSELKLSNIHNIFNIFK